MLRLILLFVPVRKPWLAAISHPKPSIVLSHGLSRLASRKDCKPAVKVSKPRLWSLLVIQLCSKSGLDTSIGDDQFLIRVLVKCVRASVRQCV